MAADTESLSFMALSLVFWEVVQLKYETDFRTLRETVCNLYEALGKLVEAKPNWDDPDNGEKYQRVFLEFLQILGDALESNGRIEDIDRMSRDWRHKYYGKNVLSLSIDKIMEVISTLPRIMLQRRPTCMEFLISVITKLRNYDRASIVKDKDNRPSRGFDPSLPLTIWQAPEKLCLSYHPGVFAFSCPACKDEDNSIAKFVLRNSDITSLVHATSTKNLLAMIQGGSSPDEFLELKGSRGMDKQQNKFPDLTPQGLIYCGVNINEFIANIPQGERPRHMMDKRYGIFEIHFDLPSSTTETRRYFNLGTKEYVKEFSQLLLVSQRPEDFWWLSGKTGNNKEDLPAFFQKLEETTLDESWEWVVKYCRHEYWTHPELIIPGTLKIPWSQVKIKMVERHACIKNDRRKSCYDCKNCPRRVDKSWGIMEFARLIKENDAWTEIETLQEEYKFFDEVLYALISLAVMNLTANNLVQQGSVDICDGL